MLFSVWGKILLDPQRICGHIELCVSWKLALFHVFGLWGVTLTVLLTGRGWRFLLYILSIKSKWAWFLVAFCFKFSVYFCLLLYLWSWELVWRTHFFPPQNCRLKMSHQDEKPCFVLLEADKRKVLFTRISWEDHFWFINPWFNFIY